MENRIAVLAREISRPVVLCAVLLTAGCKYDGSFMQMNSDTPAPFLGLQWSVGSRAERTLRFGSEENGGQQYGEIVRLRESSPEQRGVPQQSRGDIRFTLRRSEDSVESVDRVNRRLTGF